jgi:hypothetical protein
MSVVPVASHTRTPEAERHDGDQGHRAGMGWPLM